MKATIDDLVAKLEDLSILTMNPHGQRIAAESLLALGLSRHDLDLVWWESKRISGAEPFARTEMSRLVQDPTRCLQVAEKLRARASRQRHEVEVSGIAHVTETNPYGWRDAEAMAAQDHDIPGAWNAYRQSYNMTMQEAREIGNHDTRRRGCSRVEVLGEFVKTGWRPGKPIETWAGAQPKPDYDDVEVQRARNFSPGSVPVTRELVDEVVRDIYGSDQRA